MHKEKCFTKLAITVVLNIVADTQNNEYKDNRPYKFIIFCRWL